MKSQINASQPIFMKMFRTKDDGTKGHHGLVLIGYSDSEYTIINPWYQYSLKIPKKNTGSQVTYVTGTKVYTWQKSVYLGKISSIVEHQPDEEFQSNDNILGASLYQYGEKLIVAFQDKSWIYFPEKEKSE